MRKRLTPLVIFAIGTIVFAALVAIALVFFNAPQCPSYYQPVPGDTSCIVGANIGLGLFVFAAIALWVVVSIVAMTLYCLGLRRRYPNKNQLFVRCLAVCVVTSLLLYAGIRLAIMAVQHFVRD